ncbi:MAG: hypothetical protein LBC40_07250 [Dysgonamonadaceae bacterium]|jgi:hypothetical protein|nr:hypothetical protein [Dysgonamonadaceae bacterium]
MKTTYKKNCLLALIPVLLTGCLFSDYPIDEDGLLITDRTECYVSSLQLLGIDGLTVLLHSPTDGIDTVACTIHADVKWGVDLKHLYPQFTLAQDCKLEPKITGITDFSDLEHPRQYTVISGNRAIRKTYTLYIQPQNAPQ